MNLSRHHLRIALLTGGGDRPYALGLASALTACGVHIDFVGSDHLLCAELTSNPRVNFVNLRGNQEKQTSLRLKIIRLLRYYCRLLWFAVRTESPVFHILWNNKFEWFDRTLLLILYKICRRRLVLTAHNVNAGRRDGTDNLVNRLTLRVQYKLVDHVFVHTRRALAELQRDFNVPINKVSVIPFGINNTIMQTSMTVLDARRRLSVPDRDLTMLFFGQIAPYKGLQYLLAAFAKIKGESDRYRLLLAGCPKWDGHYWNLMEKRISELRIAEKLTKVIRFIPDDQIELFFKAADVIVLPYTDIFQSGVLSLAYSFGLPVIATDVGSLREEIVEGRTGFVCAPRDPESLALAIRRYFESNLFRDLERHRSYIQQYASERYSWAKVAKLTIQIYAKILEVSFGTTDVPNSLATPGNFSQSEVV